MPQINIPTIKWGKRKPRSQMCEAFLSDGNIVDIALPVLRKCVDNEKTSEAFLINDVNQFKG